MIGRTIPRIGLLCVIHQKLVSANLTPELRLITGKEACENESGFSSVGIGHLIYQQSLVSSAIILPARKLAQIK